LTDELRQLLAGIPARVGFYWEDLSDGRSLAYGDERFPAASVIKVPILLEVYRRAEAGTLALEKRVPLRESDKVGGAGVLLEMHEGLEVTVEDLARLMTVVSDNTASNLLINEVGMEAINALMASLGMDQSHLGRRFMETPAPGRDNRMSPRDAALCLKEVWRRPGRGPLEILRRQQYREKIPLLLPEELVVAHKTGELDGVRHDAALVERERPYVLAIFTAEGGASWEVDLGIARVSRYCFERL